MGKSAQEQLAERQLEREKASESARKESEKPASNDRGRGTDYTGDSY